MNKYFKAVSILLVLTSGIYIPNTNAASSTDMLLTIAETNPVLVDRLNEVALNDAKQLNQLLKMADSDPIQLERLVNLAEADPEIFKKLVTISNAKLTPKTGRASVNGIGDGGVIRT